MGLYESLMSGGKAVGNWFSADPQTGTPSQAPIVLGELASALMGNQQDSWQARTGKIASGMGQSSIANARLKQQQEEQKRQRQLIMQYLMRTPGTGVGLTDPDSPGDTDVTVKYNPDGTYKRTVSGRVLGPGMTPQTQDPTTQAKPLAPTTGPRPAGVPQNQAGYMFDPRLVPLF